MLYIAKHDSGGNDDEGAVTHALTRLGHDVQRLREEKGSLAKRVPNVDLLLFHKWDDVEMLQRFDGICPRAFWYFDLVDWPSDPSLAGRCQGRREWMARITPHVELGFCTDGDWVAQDTTGKLRWLPQGADERMVGRGSPEKCPTCSTPWTGTPILFTGISRGGGRRRESFVEEMQTRWRDKFRHVQAGVHGRALADLVASSQAVVCPDSPVTDRYWSNRVYLLAGFGATLLHPYCKGLRDYGYTTDEVLMYRDRQELRSYLDAILQDSNLRDELSAAALERTKREHLYRHRVQKLIEAVEGLRQ